MRVCEATNMSRQNYYKRRQQRQKQALKEEALLAWVKVERGLQSRLGGLKLHHRMKEQEVPFSVGRDRFFKFLKRKDLLISPEPSTPRTTNSYHCLPVFTNRVAQAKVDGPNQVWVSDLTYVDTREGFLYLFLISDLFSHKIVGHYLSESMQTKDALVALRKSCSDLPVDKRPIHHSDRGCQYCSHEYVNEVLAEGLSLSMTEENHCYENAQAERLNGILKQEYGLGGQLPSKRIAAELVEQAVSFYNTIRPHRSLKMDYPSRVHERAAPMGADPSLN